MSEESIWNGRQDAARSKRAVFGQLLNAMKPSGFQRKSASKLVRETPNWNQEIALSSSVNAMGVDISYMMYPRFAPTQTLLCLCGPPIMSPVRESLLRIMIRNDFPIEEQSEGILIIPQTVRHLLDLFARWEDLKYALVHLTELKEFEAVGITETSIRFDLAYAVEDQLELAKAVRAVRNEIAKSQQPPTHFVERLEYCQNIGIVYSD